MIVAGDGAQKTLCTVSGLLNDRSASRRSVHQRKQGNRMIALDGFTTPGPSSMSACVLLQTRNLQHSEEWKFQPT